MIQFINNEYQLLIILFVWFDNIFYLFFILNLDFKGFNALNFALTVNYTIPTTATNEHITIY